MRSREDWLDVFADVEWGWSQDPNGSHNPCLCEEPHNFCSLGCELEHVGRKLLSDIAVSLGLPPDETLETIAERMGIPKSRGHIGYSVFEGRYLLEEVQNCTCSGGLGPYHEPGCGANFVQDLTLCI